MEIFDQFSRKRPEGEMGAFLNDSENNKNSFIRNRLGLSIDNFRNNDDSVTKGESQSIAVSYFRSLRKFLFDSSYRTHFLMKKLCPKHFKVFSIHPSESFLNEIILMFFSSLTYKEMKEATFRNSGEVHQQSFDQFKLKRLLLDIGFCEASKKTAKESSIENWTSYGLDTTPEGFEKKADSLYMEAFKYLQI